ncbi:MAG: electron transfer flavoprotein subunit alpha/FixB family protein, partial [Candidatus Binataceae bacterium]
LGLGLTGDAIAIELDAENRSAPAPVATPRSAPPRMVALKPVFGGNIVAPILSKTYPQMATVRAGVLEMAEPNGSRKAELEQVRLELKPPLSRLVKAHTLLDPSVQPLEGAALVVGIGMGVGAEGVERVKELARALSAGICATRQVTDAGWVPRQLQVGLTGKAIDPRLYIAVGVRGAPNHIVGIKRAQTVVAINNDSEAPIFERATIGVVADWAKIVPRLTWLLRARMIE